MTTAGPPPPPLPEPAPAPFPATRKADQPLGTISIQDLNSVQLRRTTKLLSKTMSAPLAATGNPQSLVFYQAFAFNLFNSSGQFGDSLVDLPNQIIYLVVGGTHIKLDCRIPQVTFPSEEGFQNIGWSRHSRHVVKLIQSQKWHEQNNFHTVTKTKIRFMKVHNNQL